MSTELQVYQEFHGFSQSQEAMLKERLQEANIKQRPGAKGRNLKYIKGDYAIATANRIFGLGKWGYKVVGRSHEVTEDEKKGKIEYYTADIELMVAGSAFPFPGDGMGIVTAPYTIEMHEKARKEATTDALKRALRHYGDQFGLSLYDEDNYVEDDNGHPVQVKNVGKPQNNNPKPALRVVDAEPTSTITAPTPTALRERHKFLGMHDDFETVKKKVFKREIIDDELTPDMCITLNGVFERFYEKQAVGVGK